MKTPSQYPVLEGRAIDQWKVTELKEELKRRKLTIKGLKEDLVKRLDEALRDEREVEEEQTNNVVEDSPQSQNTDEPTKTEVDDEPTKTELDDDGPTKTEVDAERTKAEVDDEPTKTELDDDEPDKTEVDAVVVAEQETVSPSQMDSVETGEAVTVTPVIIAVDPVSNDEDASVGSKLVIQGDRTEEKEADLMNGKSLKVEMSFATAISLVGVDENRVSDSRNTLSESVTGEAGLENDKMETDNEDIKPSHKQDVKLDTSYLNNQVSEVSTNLGFHVKSNNSLSSDSVCVNEKNELELEDNLIADNDVKLEPDAKPEMVQPSSSELVPDDGESHPKGVEEPHENIEDTINNLIVPDISPRNHTSDLGSPEKLNLDRSSGDYESMEEDAFESKQIDSNNNSELGEKTEKNEVTTVKDQGPSAAMAIEEKNNVEAPLFEKRKLPEQEVNQNNEPSKRVRRWKTENKDNNREPQISNNAPKDVLESAPLKRTSNNNPYSDVGNDSPKERVVPPSTKAATTSLRIDRFLRPFTLKAVQELVGKTGTVSSFWMDHIKTHCYVTYSCVEEAVATRDAVYNLQWPPNGGRNLVAEFVDPEEVKMRVETPLKSGPTKERDTPSTVPLPSPRQQSVKQRLSEQPSLPPPPPLPPLSHPAPAREWAQPPPPPPKEKVEAPIVTLDDLFRKTKATPRIYYLPLSEDQVAARLEERRKSSRP